MTRTIHITLITAIITLTTAIMLESSGYKPCPLCLKGRYAWWSIIAISPILYILPTHYKKIALIIIAFILMANVVLSVYHAGGEWNWWSLSAACSPTDNSSVPSLNDVFSAPQVCSDAALRIFGISLAGYNAIISLALMCIIVYNIKYHER